MLDDVELAEAVNGLYRTEVVRKSGPWRSRIDLVVGEVEGANVHQELDAVDFRGREQGGRVGADRHGERLIQGVVVDRREGCLLLRQVRFGGHATDEVRIRRIGEV